MQMVTAIAFVGLGVAITASWLRSRARARGYLALAIGGISMVALLGRVQLNLNGLPALAVQELSIAFFMASGYGLILFRHLCIAYPKRTLRTIQVVVVAVTIAAMVNAVSITGSHPGPMQGAVILAVILVWSGCVLEPAVRFLLAARTVPSVQKARLRALAIGFIGLAAILIVSGGAGASLNGAGQVVVQVIALVLVAFLYVSFLPPGWVRREWRVPEEEALRAAIQDLLLFSPDQRTLARRAVEWGRRLVGGDAALIVDPSGHLWAAVGLSDVEAEALVLQLGSPGTIPQVVPLEGRPAAVVAALPMEEGTGLLAVLSGPFTPVFGSEELGLLQQYSSAITVGLDRCRLTERLAALERTKSEFLNLASHELRGPVTVIRGYLSMMQKGTMGTTSPAVAAALPILSAKADQMNLLIEQMIEAARLEEGRLELKPERVDLRELAARAVDLMRPLGEAGHEIVLDADRGAVPVEVDPGRISTIITNLLDNAIKYSPGGGAVRCEVQRDSTAAIVSVTDTGVGIDPADLPRLFTRFGRISTRETQHIGGTGLGLYLCRELARLHGGDITVETQPGVGSTFQLRVPLVAANA